MHIPTLLLHALKGTCALNCLAALHLAGPRPVTQRAVMDLTGFEDRAVRKGLHTLLALGLVTCTGERHHTAWQLAPAAEALSAPLANLLPNPQNAEARVLKEEEREKEREKELFNLADSSFEGVQGESAKNADSGSGRQTAQARALRQQFYAAFEAGEIYLQFRRGLADSLLTDDGAAWLRQTLGWICYAQRRLPHIKRGAVVYISLRDRLPCDPAYLPPPGLAFEAALAWAARGGEAEPEPADAEEAAVAAGAGAGETAGAAEAAPAEPDTPEWALWHKVLERLSLELPPSVVAAHLCALRPARLDERRCVLAAPTRQSRDWLTRRLAGVVARALGEETGKNITVEFVSD